MKPASASAFRRARGATLLEALVAFLVLSLGMLTMARVQTSLRLNSDIARQRTEAVRLAEADMESLRNFGSVSVSQGLKAYAEIATATRSISAGQGGTNVSFEVSREVTPVEQVHTDSGYKSATVSVNWFDRTGTAQRVVLDSVIAATPPALSAALAITPRQQAVRSVAGRAVSVPLTAKDLGDGRSVLKPDSAQGTLFVIDNASGRVSAVCTGVAARTRDITAADVVSCNAVSAMLLSGQVRFSLAGVPDAARANDTPLPLAMALALSGGAYPGPAQCGAEAMKTVAYSVGNSTRREAVPLAATPVSWGVAAWSELGERYVAYHCAVQPTGTPARWSGRSSVQPQGWALGATATTHKVCRYSADQDNSGSVDRNAEHPDSYTAVDVALAQQNFLVVKGDQACPGGSAVKADGQGAQNFANLGTLQHQP